MLIYPAIDIMGGRCVRLVHGAFDSAKTYGDHPLDVAREFARAGATHLHVVDLEGSRRGAPVEAVLVRRLVAESGLKVQVGGGIRTARDVEDLSAAGADRVVLGSLAARDPDLLRQLLETLGPERLTLALDVRLAGLAMGSAQLAVEGWTRTAATGPWDLLSRYLQWGGRYVLVTDIGRDGALTGVNQDLYRDLARTYPEARLLASGGVSSLGDLQDLGTVPVFGAVVGKALYEGRFTLKEALACS